MRPQTPSYLANFSNGISTMLPMLWFHFPNGTDDHHFSTTMTIAIMCGSSYYIYVSLSLSCLWSIIDCDWPINCKSTANSSTSFSCGFPTSNFQLTPNKIVTMTDFINCHIICLTVGLVSASTKYKKNTKNYIKSYKEKRKTITWNAWKIYGEKESQANKPTSVQIPFENITQTLDKNDNRK